jgi:hypothetical protein
MISIGIVEKIDEDVFVNDYSKFKENFPNKKKRFLLLLIGGIIPIIHYTFCVIKIKSFFNYFRN